MAKSGKPLQGVRVLEFARVLAGPWAGQLLADLGADVIKIESPDGGDETRHWGPPFVTAPDGENLSAAYFQCCNRGKRSVALDLKNSDDLSTARQLAAQADVIIENFKVETMDRFGLGHRDVAAGNPAIVYCSITGFGQTGPHKDRAGYDFIIQGLSGFMSVTGEADGAPMKAGVAITDVLTGLYAVSAINAALVQALKSGQGAHLDIALMEVMAASLANQNQNFLATGEAPNRLGNAHPNIAPYQVVPTDDGHVIIAVGNDGQFSRLCGLLGISGSAADARFASNQSRVENRGALTALLEAETRKWTRVDLIAACEANTVPVGPINTIADMFADPQVQARGLQIMTASGVPAVRSPLFIDGVAAGDVRAAPRLGEHTHDVKNHAAAGWPTP
ncbi:MAG: CaiB/BaiF CoA-transferase family protein [Pseudomonadota bacterium]